MKHAKGTGTVKKEALSFPRGTILRLQKMSTEDGPGIRSTVFFKGCPLRCVWCHNPESISSTPEVHWVSARCIGCMGCLASCPEQALCSTAEGISIDRSKCTGCLSCTEACPSTALEAYGRPMIVDELVREIVKDRVFYEKSGGGATLSGGEPTLQSAFARALLKELKEQGIHTALDTCGQCQWDTLESLLPFADLVLFDVKLIAPEPHKEYTGVTSTLILDNLLKLSEYMEKTGSPKDLWIRTPVIPGYTANPVNIRAIGTFIREKLIDRVGRWDLCAFNRLCSHKYEELGIDWTCKDVDLVPEEEMERLAGIAAKVLDRQDIVFTSGQLRKEAETPKLTLINGGKA